MMSENSNVAAKKLSARIALVEKLTTAFSYFSVLSLKINFSILFLLKNIIQTSFCGIG